MNASDYAPAYNDQGEWNYANTYAPWDLDVGDEWLNNLASQFPNENNVSGWTPQNVLMGMGGMALGVGAPFLAGAMPAFGYGGNALLGGATAGMANAAGGGFNPFQDSWPKFMHTLSGKGSKRGTPNYYAPSYQGMAFTPQETGYGVGRYGEGQQSQEAIANQAQMAQMNQQNEFNAGQVKSLTDTLQGSFYDYNYGNTSGAGTHPQGKQSQVGAGTGYYQQPQETFTPNYVGQADNNYPQQQQSAYQPYKPYKAGQYA